MDFIGEGKSLFPISSTHSPLFLSKSDASLVGKRLFNPIPDSITTLLTSPSLSPPCLPPPSRLSLPRFFQTTTPNSPILPSTASAISDFSYFPEAVTCIHNRLESLPCPNNRVLTFFPTGDNMDRIGFLMLSVGDSGLSVDVGGRIFMSDEEFNHQIVKLSACPISDYSFIDGGSSASVSIGFLMAWTMYSIHWFDVRIKGLGSDSEKPSLVYLGNKQFKSCALVHACWSPHLSKECVALLESGALFLFDVYRPSSSGLGARFGGKKLRVSWVEACPLEKRGWLSCEFSWHPQILVVANMNAVFLVDFRTEKCHASYLLKIDMLGTDDILMKDRFVSFSKAGPDGFFYCVASESWLLLCDVREPLMPLLRWAHNINEPRFLTVIPLSELRSNTSDDKYTETSGKGFCIILGSFWNCDFRIFCYGPSPSTPRPFTTTKAIHSTSSFYVWELPSQLSLSGRDCFCGSCLLREDFTKDDLPPWIEWQQKKELVLGFFILRNDLSSQVSCMSHDSGGFTLVRLMSSGKLEAQRYGSFWDVGVVGPYHDTLKLQSHGSFLCSFGNEDYNFPKRFKYLELDHLYSYLNGSLSKALFSKFRKSAAVATNDKRSDTFFREFMSDTFKMLGFDPCKSSHSVPDVFRDVSFPTSLYEMACRKTWTMLPIDTLELAFSSYPEILSVVIDSKRVSLDFLVVPDQTQLPPFFARNPSHRSNKWSGKVKRSNDLVGPVVPLPVLLVLNEIFKHGYSFLERVPGFSPDMVLAHQCEEIEHQAKTFGFTGSMNDPHSTHPHTQKKKKKKSHSTHPHTKKKKEKKSHSTHPVSLMDDKEDTRASSSITNRFFMYKPSALSDELGTTQKDCAKYGEKYMKMIGKFSENEGIDWKTDQVSVEELFNDPCSLDLKFDSLDLNFEPNELKAYKKLKMQFSKWKRGFSPYQEFYANLRPQSKGL